MDVGGRAKAASECVSGTGLSAFIGRLLITESKPTRHRRGSRVTGIGPLSLGGVGVLASRGWPYLKS